MNHDRRSFFRSFFGGAAALNTAPHFTNPLQHGVAARLKPLPLRYANRSDIPLPLIDDFENLLSRPPSQDGFGVTSPVEIWKEQAQLGYY